MFVFTPQDSEISFDFALRGIPKAYDRHLAGSIFTDYPHLVKIFYEKRFANIKYNTQCNNKI